MTGFYIKYNTELKLIKRFMEDLAFNFRKFRIFEVNHENTK